MCEGQREKLQVVLTAAGGANLEVDVDYRTNTKDIYVPCTKTPTHTLLLFPEAPPHSRPYHSK